MIWPELKELEETFYRHLEEHELPCNICGKVECRCDEDTEDLMEREREDSELAT